MTLRLFSWNITFLTLPNSGKYKFWIYYDWPFVLVAQKKNFCYAICWPRIIDIKCKIERRENKRKFKMININNWYKI